MTKGNALQLYLDGILDESRSSEEDAVSPGRHASLLTAVVAKGVSSVLVKFVGGAEGDGRLPDIPESIPCIHLSPTLILQCAMLGSLCNDVVVVQWCGHHTLVWLLCNSVGVMQCWSCYAVLWSLCIAEVIGHCCALLWLLCYTVIKAAHNTECAVATAARGFGV